MPRRRTRRTMLILVSVTFTVLALIAGAILFTSQKAINAHAATGQALSGNTGDTANTIQQTTPATDNAQPAAPTAIPTQVAGNPTPATTKQQTNPAQPANPANPTVVPTNTTTGNTAPNPAAPVTQPNASTLAQSLKFYGTSIQHMVAQGLNVSDKELATQLQAGKHLTDIAQAQGVSATQLQTLISTSIQNGFAPAVQGGQLTQADVTSFVTQTQQNPQMLEQTLSSPPPAPPHW